MSVEALTWAFGVDASNSGRKLLLVALANQADQYGATYIGQEALALACSCARETVSRNMNMLETEGLIARVQRRRVNGSRTSDWTVLAPNALARGPMKDAPGEEFPPAVALLARRGEESAHEADSSREDGTARHVTNQGGPEPLEEPSASRGSARTTMKKIGGKPVNAEAWAMTCAALAAFNAAAGKKFGATSADGAPSESAKRIYNRVRAFPDLTIEDHERIIRRTLASKWWGDDPPSVGVVYGPRVFEDNMERPEPKGRPGAAGSGDSGSSRYDRED